MKLLKNDTVRYFDELIEGFGGIKGYGKMVQFSEYLTEKYPIDELKLMKGDLKAISIMLLTMLPVAVAILSLFLTLVITVLAVILAFYFNLSIEQIKLGQNFTMFNLNKYVLLPLIIIVSMLLYFIFKVLFMARKAKLYFEICKLAIKKAKNINSL